MTLKVTALAIAAVTLCSSAAAQTPNHAPADSERSVAQYRDAAGQGQGVAMFALAASYWAGRGVPEDQIEAYKWLELAVSYSTNREQETAVQARTALARVLTPTQIDEAKRRAREWEITLAKKK